ncbi:hypothetical protein HMPREF1861_02345 [Corynebacterium kroppenstedtii]|nr:hypothetical protein HMPREF1861_02345 [Corynebacterium kroppenstedtii]
MLLIRVTAHAGDNANAKYSSPRSRFEPDTRFQPGGAKFRALPT